MIILPAMNPEKLGIENDTLVPVTLPEIFSDETEGEVPLSEREEFVRAVLAVVIRPAKRALAQAQMAVLYRALHGCSISRLKVLFPGVSAHHLNAVMVEVAALLAAGKNEESAEARTPAVSPKIETSKQEKLDGA